MKRADVIKHFGSQVAVARALGITKGAVNQWGDRVPLEMALRIQGITGGSLKADLKRYNIPGVNVNNMPV